MSEPSSTPPESPPAASAARVPWRTIGIGALGLVGGLLLALVVQDVLAFAFLRQDTMPGPVAIVIGILMPALGVLGVVLAVRLDRRATQRRPTGQRR